MNLPKDETQTKYGHRLQSHFEAINMIRRPDKGFCGRRRVIHIKYKDILFYFGPLLFIPSIDVTCFIFNLVCLTLVAFCIKT